MTVYGAIIAAVSRKVGAFLAEVRTLVAKADIKAIEKKAETEVETLKNDLVNEIAKL